MKVFSEYLEFYNFLKQTDLPPDIQDVKSRICMPFMNAVGNIDKGCGCQKQKRKDRIVTEYLALGSKMTEEDTLPIKLYFQVSVLQFKHNQGLFFEV